jgi:hypothetical protein
MSRAGRRARRTRLEAEGLWVVPARKVAPLPPPREIQVALAMHADRDEWVWRAGTCGWEAEQARRRHARNLAARAKRLAVLWRGDQGRAA